MHTFHLVVKKRKMGKEREKLLFFGCKSSWVCMYLSTRNVDVDKRKIVPRNQCTLLAMV